MVELTDIQTAWMTDAKANITGLVTAAPHEKEFDESTLASLTDIALPPFALFRFVGSDADEGQRLANGASGAEDENFMIALGAETLISKNEGQASCYTMLDDFRSRYDGFVLPTTSGDVVLAFKSRGLVFSGGGLMVYCIMFSFREA